MRQNISFGILHKNILFINYLQKMIEMFIFSWIRRTLNRSRAANMNKSILFCEFFVKTLWIREKISVKYLFLNYERHFSQKKCIFLVKMHKTNVSQQNKQKIGGFLLISANLWTFLSFFLTSFCQVKLEVIFTDWKLNELSRVDNINIFGKFG